MKELLGDPAVQNVVIAVVGFLVVWLMKDFKKTVDNLCKDVESMNLSLVKLLERDETKHLRIEDNKNEIVNLRDRLHGLVNNEIGRLKILEIKLDALEKRIEKLENLEV